MQKGENVRAECLKEITDVLKQGPHVLPVCHVDAQISPPL